MTSPTLYNKSTKKLVEAVDKEVSGLSNFAGQTTSEIQSATAGMENAAKLLDKNLDDVLDRTFTSFDSSLTDISQHLSGTIADVRDTTEAPAARYQRISEAVRSGSR